MQPAEFMKLGLIVGMAVLFAQRAARPRRRRPPTTCDVAAGDRCWSPCRSALIMLQPDLGSAMVLGCAAFGVLIAAGVRAALDCRAARRSAVAGRVAGDQGRRAGTTTSSPGSPRSPIPTTTRRASAYNITQAHIAIANGGLFGTGLFNGPQTNGGFVPEQQTDFVFSVAGEEFGLVGGGRDHRAVRAAVLARPAHRPRRPTDAGRLVAVGVVCWFAFQAFQNIGMNLGLTPVTGLPLPFVSYGGSSMFAQGLALGLLQAVRSGARLI